jgi:hypothetical protein
MAYRYLPLESLVVNPANDRHGALESEPTAIARLFALNERHMRNLTKDIVGMHEVFEPPLVYPEGKKFIVADGNRRTTCLKLLAKPKKAPTVELQAFFAEQRKVWNGKFPERIQCRVEVDRDRVDDILYRRHTGAQRGIGQTRWDDRMRDNFVLRTGKEAPTNVADQVEKLLAEANMLPTKKIPRSNMNRLLSAEVIRNRLGFGIKKGKLELLRSGESVRKALQRVASDLATGKVVLGDIWDAEDKLAYIDKLDVEGVLPTAKDAPPKDGGGKGGKAKPKAKPAPKPAPRVHLMTDEDYHVQWVARLQRHREIWDELQFKLELSEHPNAISVLLRVLIELAVENYIEQKKLTTAHPNDKLSNKLIKVADDLFANKNINMKYLGALKKLKQSDDLISMDTLNRYVHSPQFTPSPEHMKAIWDTMAAFVVLCLNA